MLTARWYIVLMTGALLAAACGGDSDDAGGVQAELADRVFVSESIEGWELVPGTQVRLRFRDRELLANAGCNSIEAQYAVQAGVLELGGYGMTEMGCDPARHAQDDWLVAFLGSKPALELAEPRLTMTTSSARMILLDREVASPDRPLVGTQWIGEAIGDGNVVQGGLGTTLFSIRFDADGTALVHTSCQSGTGAYQVDGTTITFVGLTYDAAPCSDPSHQAVSDRVLFVLDGAPVAFAIEETALEIRKATSTLYFRAQS